MDSPEQLTPKETEIISSIFAEADRISMETEEKMQKLRNRLHEIYVLIDDRHGSTLSEYTQRIDEMGYIVNITPDEISTQEEIGLE